MPEELNNKVCPPESIYCFFLKMNGILDSIEYLYRINIMNCVEVNNYTKYDQLILNILIIMIN